MAVEVVPAGRQPISLYLETQGTLEAEREVDLVARVAGPIVELATEEGMPVREGRLLARIDDREIAAQLEVARVRLEETRAAYDRLKSLYGSELVSEETVEQALANYQSAQGDHERLLLQREHTRISAPFSGLIVKRYVKFAEHLAIGAPLFRLSDFDPLLCPIQVPERELPRLHVGQKAELGFEAWPGERFAARVLRISPVVEAATGTFKVTLEVASQGRLRPGMFASVFLELATRESALVVPKRALALDSLGDTVFVVANGVAERRNLELGFQNEELLEVVSGLRDGEMVVVAGQDNLSEGAAVEVATPGAAGGTAAQPPAPAMAPGDRGGPPDPGRLDQVRQRMRERGLSEAEIEERIKSFGQGGGRGRTP